MTDRRPSCFNPLMQSRIFVGGRRRTRVGEQPPTVLRPCCRAYTIRSFVSHIFELNHPSQLYCCSRWMGWMRASERTNERTTHGTSERPSDTESFIPSAEQQHLVEHRGWYLIIRIHNLLPQLTHSLGLISVERMPKYLHVRCIGT